MYIEEEKRYLELISLHEELLSFLISFRSQYKNQEKPGFLFRPQGDAALKEGRWFYDHPEWGWVNLYFTKNAQSGFDSNNLKFDINISGKWQISICQETSDLEFWNRAIRSFSNILERVNDKYFKMQPSKWITLYPIEKDYKKGLPEAIEVFLQFLKQENYYISETNDSSLPITIIPEGKFQDSLKYISVIKNTQKTEKIYLNSFQIKKYQGIRETNLTKLPGSPSWIFITGENGYGKTCFLKALSIGLYGDEEDIITPRDKEPEIIIDYTKEFSNHLKIRIKNNYKFPLFFRSIISHAAYGPFSLRNTGKG